MAASATPLKKLEHIQMLQKKAHRVAMVSNATEEVGLEY